jgi:hypothetical protein
MYLCKCELSAAAGEGHQNKSLFCLLLVVLQGTLEIFMAYFFMSCACCYWSIIMSVALRKGTKIPVLNIIKRFRNAKPGVSWNCDVRKSVLGIRCLEMKCQFSYVDGYYEMLSSVAGCTVIH